ncbi:MAG: hypothetical protein PHF23_01725 [Smithellaceae bacterium]|jgi:hypothetical protein|nr:hypothetical protein [Smithellaceae bacterium]
MDGTNATRQKIIAISPTTSTSFFILLSSLCAHAYFQNILGLPLFSFLQKAKKLL